MEKYKDQIVGVLSGFDRLVFRGSLRRLNYGYWEQGLGAMVARGMEQYLWQNQILFKDYAQHVKVGGCTPACKPGFRLTFRLG